MPDINPGTLGAKRATWRAFNPRELLQRIVRNHPLDDEKIWREMFWSEIEDNKQYLQAVCEYWLDNNIRSISGEQTYSRGQASPTVKTKLQDRALLDLMMPNNKVLGQCTGAECKSFGGWFQQLAKAVLATKKVAETLSEAQVRKLWLANK